MNKALTAFFLLILLIPLANAATISGSIYDQNLDVATNTLLKVDSSPEQQILARDGTYQFQLEPGTYTITIIRDEIYIQEQISITTEGEFTRDLFLIPDFLDEEELWSEDEALDDEGYKFNPWQLVAISIVALITIWRVLAIKKRIKKHKEAFKAKKERHLEGDKPLEDILKLLRQEDGRMTQKQLRKNLMHLSEGKVSLLLSELEHKGKIEKIKKGRGNIIVLKE